MFSALKTAVALSLAVAALGVALAAVSVPEDASNVFAGRMWQHGIGTANVGDFVPEAHAAHGADPLQDRFYKPAVVLLASR
jgi:hypothetical protein